MAFLRTKPFIGLELAKQPNLAGQPGPGIHQFLPPPVLELQVWATILTFSIWFLGIKVSSFCVHSKSFIKQTLSQYKITPVWCAKQQIRVTRALRNHWLANEPAKTWRICLRCKAFWWVGASPHLLWSIGQYMSTGERQVCKALEVNSHVGFCSYSGLPLFWKPVGGTMDIRVIVMVILPHWPGSRVIHGICVQVPDLN